MCSQMRYANSSTILVMNVNYIIVNVISNFSSLFGFYPTAKAAIRFQDFKITKERICMFVDMFG